MRSFFALALVAAAVSGTAHAATKSELLAQARDLAYSETRSSLSAEELNTIIRSRIDQFGQLCGRVILPNYENPYSHPVAAGLYVFLRRTPPFLLASHLVEAQGNLYKIIPSKRETTGGSPGVAYAKFFAEVNFDNIVTKIYPNVLGTDLGEYELCSLQ